MHGTFTRCLQGLLDGSLLASLSACGNGPPPRVDFLLGPYSAALTEPAAKVPTRPLLRVLTGYPPLLRVLAHGAAARGMLAGYYGMGTVGVLGVLTRVLRVLPLAADYIVVALLHARNVLYAPRWGYSEYSQG